MAVSRKLAFFYMLSSIAALIHKEQEEILRELPACRCNKRKENADSENLGNSST